MTTPSSALWGFAVGVGSALRRSNSSVATKQSQDRGWHNRAGYYRLQEHYYFNTVFDRLADNWDPYRSDYDLPRQIRPVYNPTKRAVDFVRGAVYGGTWSADGQPMRAGGLPAIPFDPDTDPALLRAAMAALTWGNWRSNRFVYPGLGGMLGDVFLEIADDRERAKDYPAILHPAYLTNVEWNGSGDVIAYSIRYTRLDKGTRCSYEKRVTKDRFATFKDDQPHGWDDNPPEWANPYGFVAAHLVMHRDVGSGHGANVIDGLHPKIDALNALASAADDYLLKLKHQPMLITSKEQPTNLSATPKRGSTSDFDPQAADRETIPWWWTSDTTASVNPMMTNFGIEHVLPVIHSKLNELEQDLPELILYRKLREMTQAPSVARMAVGDVDQRTKEVQGNYDHGLIKLLQMAIGIGGWLVNRGAWGPLNSLSEAQRAFLPFDLTSYDRGQLSLSILDRPLVPLTDEERIALAMSREALRTPAGLREAGYSDEDLYGANLPLERPGILDERREITQTAASAFGAAFDAGG